MEQQVSYANCFNFYSAALPESHPRSTHATLARDVRLAIERAYSIMLTIEDSLLSDAPQADAWVEGKHFKSQTPNPLLSEPQRSRGHKHFPFTTRTLTTCPLDRIAHMLDMMGVETLQDSQLIGRSVTSDLAEVCSQNPQPLTPSSEPLTSFPPALPIPARRRVPPSRSARHQGHHAPHARCSLPLGAAD